MAPSQVVYELPNKRYLSILCVLPVVFCAKEVNLGRQFIHSNVDMYVLVFQVVDIAEVGHELAKSTTFSFTAPAATAAAPKKFAGKDLMSQDVNGRAPLFANMLRVDVSRWRNGVNSIDLPAVSSTVNGGELTGSCHTTLKACIPY